jgi:hypothetical protein
VLSPPETRAGSEGEKLPAREELGETVPENIAGSGVGLAVEAIGGVNDSGGRGSKSNGLETPNFAPPFELSLKI